MRGLPASLALSFAVLTLQAAALPRPRFDEATDTSTVSDGTLTSPGIAQPFPGVGKGPKPSNGQGTGHSNSAAAFTPMTPDITSADLSAIASYPSPTSTTKVGAPVALTGHFLGPTVVAESDTQDAISRNTYIWNHQQEQNPKQDKTPGNTASWSHPQKQNKQESNQGKSLENPTFWNKTMENQHKPVSQQDKTPANTYSWNTAFGSQREQSARPGNESSHQRLGTAQSVRQQHGRVAGRDTRAEPDILSTLSRHGPKAGATGRDVTRNVIIHGRQANDSSHLPTSNLDDTTGELAVMQTAAEVAINAILPRGQKPRRGEALSNFDPKAPHRDGNHVATGPLGAGGVRSTIINRRRAMSSNEDPSGNTQSQVAIGDDYEMARTGMQGGKPKAKRADIGEDTGAK